MSWIVEDYLIEYAKIKNSSELESEEFSDLVSIDAAIIELEKKGVLQKKHSEIIALIKQGFLVNDLARMLNKSRHTVVANFKFACAKIAEHLGNNFTEIGFEKYMREKYNLTDKDIEKMYAYVRGRFSHRLKRR